MDVTSEYLQESIKAKSDQLNAVDLVQPRDYTIENIKKGSKEQPILVILKGESTPWKPCKSMRRVLMGVWGDQVKNWIGKRIRLFCDPSVTWAGKKVGGIRVSNVSGIDKPKKIMLTVTRNDRREWTVEPLNDEPTTNNDVHERLQKAFGEFGKCDSMERFNKLLELSEPLYQSLDEQQQNDFDKVTWAAKKRLEQ